MVGSLNLSTIAVGSEYRFELHHTPIRELDGRLIGEGRAGPITKALQKAFFDVVTGKDKKHRHWLTPVNKKGRK